MPVEIRPVDAIVLGALRSEVTALLVECTERQVAFFHSIFRDTGDLSERQLRDAIGVCQRTVTKNRAQKEEESHG
jgi:hypothetical protein